MQVRGLVGDRISLTVGTASAIAVSFILGLVILWQLAFVVISVQPLIILSFYFKKVLLTQFAMETVRAQQGASQVASMMYCYLIFRTSPMLVQRTEPKLRETETLS